MKTGKNTLIGIKLPSSRATYPNLLNIKMNHNSQAQLYIFPVSYTHLTLPTIA